MEKNTCVDKKMNRKYRLRITPWLLKLARNQKKQKQKFELTPKRKASFAKCVTARKNQL
jgi:hypothetical protein